MTTGCHLLIAYCTTPFLMEKIRNTLLWRHNERDGVSNHQPHGFLLNRLFRRRSKKTSKLRVTGICEGNSPVTREFHAQRSSKAENVSIWWRHHVSRLTHFCLMGWKLYFEHCLKVYILLHEEVYMDITTKCGNFMSRSPKYDKSNWGLI